jgi:flagellar biosynthesis/type III secretory pathway M-ring protein FliF/YscJ
MRESGQRQDVAFLALVVAVLAVAVALFVGMKALQRERPKKATPEATKQTEPAKPRRDTKAAGAARDPFRTQAGGAGVGAGGAGGPAVEMKLVGIVRKQGDEPTAVIRSGRKRYYAKVGDRAAGYTVVSIAQDQATLAKDGSQVTLVLRTPEPEE